MTGESNPRSDPPLDRALIPVDNLKLALAQATDVKSMQALELKAKAASALARKLEATLEQQNQFALLRIQVAIQLGEVLAETVQRGGLGSNSQHASSIRKGKGGSSAPLPRGITHSQSSRYQSLARVPKEHLERFEAYVRCRQKVMTVAELLRLSKRWGEPKRPLQRSKNDEGLEGVCKAIAAAMRVDVAIGLPADWLGATKEIIEASVEPPKDLCGNVAAFVKNSPKMWMERIAARSGPSEAAMLVAGETHEDWFQLANEIGWLVCFLREPVRKASKVAYRGIHKRGFSLALRNLGVIMCRWPDDY